MPLELPLDSLAARVGDLNARHVGHSATSVLETALTDGGIGPIAMVSSFGAESVALLHMLSVIDRSVPVLFVDTELLFVETLEYQLELSEKLGLTDVRRITPDRSQTFLADPQNDLHKRDPDACCAMRKVVPLENALGGFDSWITGRKRFQGGQRAALEFFEADGDARIKVNPLAHWAKEDVQDYILNNRLPRHPLVTKGYPSIGCAPCTTAVAPGEDERAGRWRGQGKVECGIHFENGKLVRGDGPRMPL